MSYEAALHFSECLFAVQGMMVVFGFSGAIAFVGVCAGMAIEGRTLPSVASGFAAVACFAALLFACFLGSVESRKAMIDASYGRPVHHQESRSSD